MTLKPIYVALAFAGTYLSTASTPTLAAETDSHADIERIAITYRQAYRGDVPASDLPQAIVSINSQTLEQLGLTEFQDALDLSSSIARQNNSGGLWDSFSLRGFPGNENMPSGYLINGFSGGRGFNGPRDSANIEHIEILKGPGSALYGRSEPGGAINIITKKPQSVQQGYIKGEWGSYEHKRLESDFTGGLTDNVAGRIIGVWQDSESFRDEVYNQRQMLTPSLHWQISADSSLLYEFEYTHQKQLFDRGIVILNNNLETVPHSRYLGNPEDGATEVTAMGHQLNYEQYLTNGWVFTAGFNHRHSELNGFSSDAELSSSRQSLFDDGETLTRQRRYRDYESDDDSLRFEFSGDITTAGIKHHLLLGADTYRYKLQTGLSRYRGGNGTYSINIFEPDYHVEAPEVALLYDNRETQKAAGAYIQDQMDLGEHWKLLLGLRFDYFDQTIHELASDITSSSHDSRLSPRVGLVYKLNDNLSFYTSYSEGFLPLSGTDYAGLPFGSEESSSMEIGAKFSWASIDGTLTLFDADKSNILVADPVNVGFSAPLGAATSRGIELDFTTMLTDTTQLLFSYTYLDTKTENDALNADWGVLIPKGSPLVNVPKNTVSAILKQELLLGKFELDAGLNFRFVDDRLGDAADLNFRLPAYQTYGIYCSWQASDALKLTLNADNLFDKRYIDSSYNALWAYPGEPRTIKVSLSYGF